MPASPSPKILVVDSHPAHAQAIAKLALDILLAEAGGIVAKAGSVATAKRIIHQLAAEPANDPVIVICATRLEGEEGGLQVLDYARKMHPRVRTVVLTDGEVDQLADAVLQGAEGVHARSHDVAGLRTILSFLAHEPTVEIELRPEPSGPLTRFEAAMEALEDARHALRRAQPDATGDEAEALRAAAAHAIAAHRLLLDAQRGRVRRAV